MHHNKRIRLTTATSDPHQWLGNGEGRIHVEESGGGEAWKTLQQSKACVQYKAIS